MEAQRFPVSVRLTGVMHKEKNKMYMASVVWSDHNEIVIYRTFRDFKQMHKQMKKQFPSTNKLKKSGRIIPKFGDKTQQRGSRKAPTKSLVCLKLLQKYCDDLLSCDPRVCQCPDLIQFFHPKDQDLQSEFPKNSILIMPTDIESGGHSPSGNVTQPFVSETYRCVAQYETKDTKNRPFKVAVDENVDVLIKDKAGWWLVEKDDKRIAWFPAPYLKKLDDDEDGDEDDIDETFERGMRYSAVKSYKATKDDEITVNIGAVVELLQKSDSGWWLVRYNGKAGYIPAMYLQPYNYPHILMTANLQNRRGSAPLQLPSADLQQSNKLNLSQGHLLQLPLERSSSPSLHQAGTKQRSRSLTILSEQPPAWPAAQPGASTSATNIATSPTSPKHAPPPIIKVEIAGEEKQHGSCLPDSDGSLESDSDVSLGDELGCSLTSSCFNLSHSANEAQLRLSRTPPPTVSGSLSPTSCQEKKIMPSVSDPNLYKGPTAPKVPPRPRCQDILTRCSSITRKNAAKGNRSPTQTEILSR
ncbi:hypothetical protein Q5P01_017413 [Channa striata]|uniref:NADPH oxidase organizer 1 n=1 Tax=Channa striata TaxID=64152 RepID=A0AA88SBJ0_CHASR|nr:hypothetical protein Q5P01_017413 [Channa striata]